MPGTVGTQKPTSRRQAGRGVLATAGLLWGERPQLLTSGLAEILERIDPRSALHQVMQLAHSLVR